MFCFAMLALSAAMNKKRFYKGYAVLNIIPIVHLIAESYIFQDRKPLTVTQAIGIMTLIVGSLLICIGQKPTT